MHAHDGDGVRRWWAGNAGNPDVTFSAMVVTCYWFDATDVWFPLSLRGILACAGETQANHEELLQFCRDFKFERMGAFAYSEEDGTPAASYPDQVRVYTWCCFWENGTAFQYGTMSSFDLLEGCGVRSDGM